MVCCALMINSVYFPLYCGRVHGKLTVHLANLVLEDTVERIYAGNTFAEKWCGLFLIRGENVVLLGEIVCSSSDSSLTLMIHDSLTGSGSGRRCPTTSSGLQAARRLLSTRRRSEETAGRGKGKDFVRAERLLQGGRRGRRLLRYITIESPLSGRFIKPQRKRRRCRLRSQVIPVITERSGISDLVRLLEHIHCRRVVTEKSVSYSFLFLPFLC